MASDDITLLKHHIEKIDTLDEIALIWVKVSRVAGNTDKGFIYMYYGNENAIGGQDAGGTFDPIQAVAFHLGEVDTSPRDATANNNHAAEFSGGQGLPGLIGNGVSLNGGGDRIVVADAPSLDFSSGFTLSAWVRINMAQSDAWLFFRQSKTGNLVVGLDGTKVWASVKDANGNETATERSADLPVGSWHYVSVTGSPGNRLSIYIDGSEMTFGNLPQTLPTFTGDLIIGDDGQSIHSFIGDLDEVGVATQPRSADRIRLAFATQGPDGLFFNFGEEVMGGGGGMPVFYLGTILRNLTLDGIIIIGMLAVLGMAGGIVFIFKAYYAWTSGKENKQFLNAFQSSPGATPVMVKDGTYTQSSLFRVYKAGCKAIGSGGTGSEGEENGVPKTTVDKKAIKAMHAELDRQYIDETKHLNSYLTILTISISGGPFLGLLGTVWGVMNTFAAMAEAGEANIMAIAPGVASALATTVAGLIVAIPALFAYNFLTARIKDITADLAVFVDQFAVRVENGHGDTA